MSGSAQHDANVRLALMAHALLTATVAGLDDQADDIIRTAVTGGGATGLLVLMALEAAGMARELAAARGVPVEDFLSERGLQVATL